MGQYKREGADETLRQGDERGEGRATAGLRQGHLGLNSLRLSLHTGDLSLTRRLTEWTLTKEIWQ